MAKIENLRVGVRVELKKSVVDREWYKGVGVVIEPSAFISCGVNEVRVDFANATGVLCEASELKIVKDEVRG